MKSDKTAKSGKTAKLKPAAKFDPTELFQAKRLFWIVTFVGLVLDLGSKMWAESAIKPAGWIVGGPSPTHPFIEGVLAWKWAGNVGAAFSILSGKVFLLAFIGIVAMAGVIWYVYKTPKDQKGMLISLGLIASGAVGNLYDRISFGWVRDFIYFDFDLPFHASVSWIPQRYPVFNVADIAILFGAVMLIFATHKMEKAEKAAAAAAEAAA